MLRDVTLRVYPNDRIGVLGANGAGKTTLLRALAGELAPLAGSLVRGRHSAVGYFAQHQLELLDLARSPSDHLGEVAEAASFSSQQTADYLGGWGFGGDSARRQAHTFSGGEKARLVLALIACRQPAVLVLDEPTNHLDLEMREALALALQQYGGALLLVSHDRRMLRRCVDSLWLVADGGVRPFRGDLDDYAASNGVLGARQTAAGTPSTPHGRHPPPTAPLVRKQQDLEARIDVQTRLVEDLDQRLGTIDGQTDQLAELARARKDAWQELQRCEQAWLDVQEELDRLA